MPTNQILTKQQFDGIIQALAVSLTGLDPNSGVRIGWQEDGSPGWDIGTDQVFMRSTLEPDPVTQQRDIEYGQDVGDGIHVQVTESYVRVRAVQFDVYGPNAEETAQAILDCLYLDSTTQTLAASNLAFIPEDYYIEWAPELFAGQFWQVGHFRVRFNESVILYTNVPYLETAQIIIEAETSGGLFEEEIAP